MTDLRHLLFFVCTIFLLSCQEYTSEYPISEPSKADLSTDFIGEWTFVSGSKSNNDGMSGPLELGGHKLRITPFNSEEYLLQLVSDSLESIKDIDHFRGYTLNIDGVRLANISPIDNYNEKRLFSIYKYEQTEDSLWIRGISEEKFRELNPSIQSVASHRSFIENVLDDSDTWTTSYTYSR